jgi:ferritin-like metal-binding protein YciE
MALFSMKLENLQQLFLKELRDLYDAEKQINDPLPR